MRRSAILVAAAGIALLVVVAPAVVFAYDEPNNATELHVGYCATCHRGLTGDSTSCASGGCHAIHGNPDATYGKGPHGVYSTTSDRCSTCHAVHVAGGAKLLAASTVTGSCATCHDGTGGRGVYGAIKARTGIAPASAHRIDTATVVPGGSAATGGGSTMAFRGPGATLTCDDCHSPHDNNTVAPFRVERWRSSYDGSFVSLHPGLSYAGAKTSRLLRKNPGGVAESVAEYGADWCAVCHQGRMTTGTVLNHPVDEATPTTPVPFTYANVVLLASDSPTSVTTTGTLAGTNRGYLMPYPRTTGPTGQGVHKPICQQCHEDARNVGTLSADGLSADAATFTITTPDGATSSDNPRFQNFPHEATNVHLLVETDDDLCLNCHPPAALP